MDPKVKRMLDAGSYVFVGHSRDARLCAGDLIIIPNSAWPHPRLVMRVEASHGIGYAYVEAGERVIKYKLSSWECGVVSRFGSCVD